MSNQQNINIWFDQFDGRLQAVPQIIAETAVENSKDSLREKQWEGKPYAPYKNKRREPSRGSLMMRSNNLFSSIQPSLVTANRVRISAGGSRAPYARVHNEGLRVRGTAYVRPHTRNNAFGKGLRVQVPGHSRKVDFKMPKRQFMGHGARQNELMRARLIRHLNQ